MPRWNQSIRVRIQRMLYRNVAHTVHRTAASQQPLVENDRHYGYTLFECTQLNNPQKIIYIEYQKDNYNLREGHFVQFNQGKWSEDKLDLFQCKSYTVIREREIPENTRYVLEKLKLPGLEQQSSIDHVIQFFGEEAPQGLKKKHQVQAILGLDDNNAQLLSGRWKDICTFSNGVQKLRNILIPGYACYAVWTHGLSTKEGAAAYVEEILNNPYLLQDDLHCMTFNEIDKTAGAALHIMPTDPRRMASMILSIFYETADTFVVEQDIFQSQVVTKNHPPEENVYAALESLIERRMIVRESQQVAADDGESRTIYSLKELNDAEKYIAHKLYAMTTADHSSLEVDFQAILESMGTGFMLDKQQMNAVRTAAQEQVTIVTGGAGTGKTHTVRAIIQMFRQNGLTEIALAAPTGKAADRLATKSHMSASTIHRLLNWDYHTNECKRNEDNPLEKDVIIIDEMSMVDTRMMARLLKAVKETTRLVFVGDWHQLQPVKQGSPFKEMCLSHCIPTAKLTQVHRQGEGSAIIKLSNKILQRTLPDLDHYPNECELHNLSNNHDIVDNVCTTIDGLLKQGYEEKDIMVLCKTHGTRQEEVKPTTKHLNMILQEKFNPNGEVLFSGRNRSQIRKGDRVIALRNHPDANIFNGYTGHAVGLNTFLPDALDVVFDENNSSYTYDKKDIGYEDGELDLAYTLTVHKSQGSEYPVVIFAFGTDRGYQGFLDRLMLYTAVTRAQKKIILIGKRQVLMESAQNKNPRHNRLRNYLKKLWTAKSKKPTKQNKGGISHV